MGLIVLFFILVAIASVLSIIYGAVCKTYPAMVFFVALGFLILALDGYAVMYFLESLKR